MQEIRFFNRLTREVETEKVYGEGFLRWTYETWSGKVALHALVKRAFFSAWYGRRMDAPSSRKKIAPFIERYGLDAAEFAEPLESFATFNEFFYRKLKPEARPVAMDSNALVLPADGRHLLIPDLSVQGDFWVKGARFEVARLIGDPALAERFEGGSALISRLCPVDYHRFHFPCGGVSEAPVAMNGDLYSVSPIALVERPSILWENKRYRTRIVSETFGEVLFFEVGATCVGAVVHTATTGSRVVKGAEKGYFRFGGSSVVTLVERGQVKWAEDLLKWSAEGLEVFGQMGELAGVKRGGVGAAVDEPQTKLAEGGGPACGLFGADE